MGGPRHGSLHAFDAKRQRSGCRCSRVCDGGKKSPDHRRLVVSGKRDRKGVRVESERVIQFTEGGDEGEDGRLGEGEQWNRSGHHATIAYVTRPGPTTLFPALHLFFCMGHPSTVVAGWPLRTVYTKHCIDFRIEKPFTVFGFVVWSDRDLSAALLMPKETAPSYAPTTAMS